MTQASIAPPPGSQRFYGWTVVWAAFVVAVFGWGLGFYGPPIYLQAVQESRGWSVALVSAAVTVHFLFGALVVVNLPRLHACFGIALVTLGGAVLLALGVTGWAVAMQPWQLFLATLFSGAGWVAMGAAGINAMVSPWFARRRPAALSMAYNGASVGGVIFSPLWVALIAWGGFVWASMVVGAGMVLIIAWLAFQVLRHTPEGMGLLPDGEAAPSPGTSAPVAGIAALRGSPWRDRAFVTLSLGMSLGLFAQIGLIAHLFSLLVPALGATGAGLAAGMGTAAAIAGRTLVGWWMPAGADRRVVAALNYGVQMLGCLALLLAGGTEVALLLLGVLLIGLGIGNATSMPPLIAQVEFSKAEVGRVVALVTATAQASYAFAPAGFGLVREWGGEAGAFFVVAAGIQAVAALCYLRGRGAFTRR